ncbi:MAG: hypothetical protein ACTHXA_11510 [Gulosibacter sp.]|uniref:hypothetical protein n=1 Tax=Gulosibacter sp. TaxID=2817531 RepID=UPI003F8F28E2
MTTENTLRYTNVGVEDPELLPDHLQGRLWTEHWLIRDLYHRILTGETLDPHDAIEILEVAIEDGDFKNVAADDFSPADSLEAVVEQLWAAAHDTAQQWDDEVTDTDRFYQAAMSVGEHTSIDFLLFSSLFDGEPRPWQRGYVALAADAWRDFDHSKVVDIPLKVDSRRPDVLITEVAADIEDQFRLAGLRATVVDESTVMVSLQWRHHVASFEDALAEAALIP